MSHRERRRAASAAGVLINEIFINDRSLHKTIEQFKDRINWKNLNYDHLLDVIFLDTYKAYIDWASVSTSMWLVPQIVGKYEKHIIWELFSEYLGYLRGFSYKWLVKYEHLIDFKSIRGFIHTPVHFLSRHSAIWSHSQWISISSSTTLQMPFIRTYQEKVHWQAISEFQKLDYEFIKEFQDKIHIPLLMQNDRISKSVKTELKSRMHEFGRLNF